MTFTLSDIKQADVSETEDISSLVLSVKGLMAKLNAILADSVILDLNLAIAAIGRDVEALIGVSSEELSGEAFADVCVETNIHDLLEQRLRRGYFGDLDATLWIRGGDACKITLSGFYLGLITDINGYVILKVKLKEDSSALKRELFTRKHELDTFIYRTAHDLRGPLATIKGLVNLLKIRESDTEVDKLTELIQVHAEKLDDRLFKLLYLANDNSHYEQGSGCIDFALLRETLVKTLEDNCQLDRTIISFQAPANEVCRVNDKAIVRLARHALLYIIALPVAAATGVSQLEIFVDCEVQDRKLLVTFNARGFHANDQIREAVRQPASVYNDLLSHPLLFNYYVAHKEATLLSGDLRIEFLNNNHQILGISVPLEIVKSIQASTAR
jgi:signal transduction histidine kinase